MIGFVWVIFSTDDNNKNLTLIKKCKNSATQSPKSESYRKKYNTVAKQ